MNSSPNARRSVLDSPWYWAYVFVAAALAALFLMRPRFDARQAQIERNYQARHRAAQVRAGERPETPLSEEGRTFIQLWPLFLILSLLLIGTGLGVWWNRSRATRITASSASSSSAEKEPFHHEPS